MEATHDPSKSLPGWEFVPYYDDPEQEYKRLKNCLQQQIEDTFTTISRIQSLDQNASTWRTLRDGLRCWRGAIRGLGC